MTQKEKRNHLFRVFLKSKGLFACFSLVLSLLLIIGSTYAWITSADERINRSDANHRKLSARIDEDFDRVYQWAPGTTQTKRVRVKNTGEMPALVRVYFEENFVSFETDQTDNHRDDANPDNNINGNANLKVYGAPSTATPIDIKKTNTWTLNNTYEVSANKHYKANLVITGERYLYGGTRTTPLPAIELNFNTGSLISDISTISGKSDYWFYQDGYFYYSEVLDPGGQTEELLTSVKLAEGYANQYKGAFYKLVPKMEAHDLTPTFLTEWGIKDEDAEKIYENNPRLPYMKTTSEGGAG